MITHFDWGWVIFIAYFGVYETIALIRNRQQPQTPDRTLTAFIKANIPIGVRVALLAWLVYHFTH